LLFLGNDPIKSSGLALIRYYLLCEITAKDSGFKDEVAGRPEK